MYDWPTIGVDGFALKVGIKGDPSTDYIEYFWLIAILKDSNGRLSGEINNQPKHLKHIQIGQRYGLRMTRS